MSRGPYRSPGCPQVPSSKGTPSTAKSAFRWSRSGSYRALRKVRTPTNVGAVCVNALRGTPSVKARKYPATIILFIVFPFLVILIAGCFLHHIGVCLACRSAPCSQYFRHRPGLRDTSTRSERRIAIENFAERAQAVRMNLFTERLEKTYRRSAIRANTEMRQHQWAEEPTPHGALMIRAVTLSIIATVMSLVAGFALREAAQSVRSNKPPGTNIDNRFLLFRGKRALRQRNGKNLIWPKSGVISNFRRVDDVIAASGRVVPEFGEALFYALRQFCKRLGRLFRGRSETSHSFQRIKP